MHELIEEARRAAYGHAVQNTAYTAGLLRRLADAADMQRIDLEGREKCHQEALAAVDVLSGKLRETIDLTREWAERAGQAEGRLSAIREYPEPEGFAFKAVIGTLRAWQAAWGKAPFYLNPGDVDQLETWGRGLLETWKKDHEILTRPRKGT